MTYPEGLNLDEVNVAAL